MKSNVLCPATNIFHCNTQTLATTKTEVTFQTFNSVDALPWNDWNFVVPKEKTFLQQEFLTGIEKGNAENVDFRYVLIYENARLVGAAHFQIIRFSVKQVNNFTKEVAAEGFLEKTKAFFATMFKDIISKFEVRILNCGNVFASGEYAFSYLPSLEEAHAFELLMKAIDELTEQESKKGKIWASVVKDFSPTPTHPKHIFEQNGFQHFTVEPLMKMDLCWENFNAYQNALSSKYRQRSKAAYKKSQALKSREMTETEIFENKALMHQWFQSVVGKAGFNFQMPHENHIWQLKVALKDKMKVTGYYKTEDGQEVLVGFMSVIRASGYVDAHFLGYSEETNNEYKIYPRILYDIVSIGIEEKFPYICFGRTAMEIKTTLGAYPNEMSLYLRINQALVNRISAPVIQNIKIEPWTPRHPFKEQEEKELSAVTEQN